jgi:hypothetical protein
MQPQRRAQRGDHLGVRLAGLSSDGRGRPAHARVLGDLDAEFLGQGLKSGVVPAALPARVLDPAAVRERVGGLVQQRPQHVHRPALQAFPTDEHLGQTLAIAVVAGVPAHRGEVAQPQRPGRRPDRAGAEQQHDRGHLGVPGADRGPRGL